ncbi:MAG TPA: HAD family hydrolase [Chitinophagaceae bacterium]|jgi:putative hydrolase of the HAD superfamily|nr:HAD family hydrolase [Chitinophagaceae bacterium]HMU59620.1 HAD family hydrolase [Chitinophagaceae bacterium]
MPIKAIAFDADDTLWVNEPYFLATEKKFCQLLADYMPEHTVSQELFKTEMQNMAIYGYGVKAFILSIIETALRISNNTVPPVIIEKIIDYGKEQLNQPVELLDGVAEVLPALKEKYKLVVATKGDLLDQERKLRKSGIEHFFHHIEIMSDKQEADYLKLIRHLDIQSSEFLMIGNSLKSDVLPVLAVGGHAVHIPYHTTWAHEVVQESVQHSNFRHFENLKDILPELL